MNAREAKREACGIVNAEIESYRSVGGPWGELKDGCTDQEIADANRLDAALVDLQMEMFNRAGGGYPARHEPRTREDLFGASDD
jgi:hypothetical protein